MPERLLENQQLAGRSLRIPNLPKIRPDEPTGFSCTVMIRLPRSAAWNARSFSGACQRGMRLGLAAFLDHLREAYGFEHAHRSGFVPERRNGMPPISSISCRFQSHKAFQGAFCDPCRMLSAASELIALWSRPVAGPPGGFGPNIRRALPIMEVDCWEVWLLLDKPDR